MEIRNILDSHDSYKKYLCELTIDEVLGINKRIDKVKYPERKAMVEQEIERRSGLEEEKGKRKGFFRSLFS